MSETIAILHITLNLQNSEELYNTTGYDIVEIICEAYRNITHKFSIYNNQIDINIELTTWFTYRDIYTDCFSIFVTTNIDNEQLLDKIETDRNIQKEIFNHICEFINDWNEEIQKISIPIPVDNFDNIIYNEKTDCFYVKLGEESPSTIKLSCKLEEGLEDIWL